MAVDADLIAEQIDYYRRRAGEYDATTRPPGDPFAADGAALVAALDAFGPTGDVLEIASGTGGWTTHLLRHADGVTALDAAPEMHERARAKSRDGRVRYVVADVFAWRPDRGYDVVFFANWLSHVPPTRFGAFWAVVEEALAPDGRVFVIDEWVDAWRGDAITPELVGGTEIPVARRTLVDGRGYRVVKVLREPADLDAHLRSLGWIAEIAPAGPFFSAAVTRTR